MNSVSVEEQLMLLKELTKTTGVISTGQSIQLQGWGSLFFEPTTMSVAIDIEGALVQYRVPAKSKTDHPKLFELAKSVKWLLGDEWVVEILKGKKNLGPVSTEEKTNAQATNGRRTRRSRPKANKKGARTAPKVRK